MVFFVSNINSLEMSISKLNFGLSVLIILAGTLMPTDGGLIGPYLDKVVHFLMFLFMASSAAIAFKRHRLWAFIACLILAFGTEYAQQFIGGRHFVWDDILANTFGVVLGFLVFWKR